MSVPTTAPIARNIYMDEESAPNAIGIKVEEQALILNSRARGDAGDLVLAANAAVQVDDLNYRASSLGSGASVEPLAGDRSAWDTTGYGARHARDISEGVLKYHLTPGALAALHPPLSLGLSTDPALTLDAPNQILSLADVLTPVEHLALGDTSPHHPPVTLSAEADTILQLSGQTIGLDVQTAHKVLAGPTTGSPIVPEFRILETSDLPSAALTKVDDTNVTLTLGGTPESAVLRAVSLTLGWLGQLSPARGGTGINNGANTLTLATPLSWPGDGSGFLKNNGAGVLTWQAVAIGTPGTLTVSTTNAAADPHTHAITSSSNPGAAAILLATDSAGALTTQTLKAADTTDATSPTTGALQSAGGLGVAKAVWMGGLLNVAGIVTLANTTDASALGTAAVVLSGGLSIAKAMITGGPVTVNSDAAAVTGTFERDWLTDANTTRVIAVFRRNYSSGAGAANIGVILQFEVKGASTIVVSGHIQNVLTTATAGSEVSDLRLRTFSAGTLATRLTVGDTVTVANILTVSGNVNLTAKVATYNNVATEGYGVPAIVDDVALTNQSADIGSTNFTNAGTAGTYRVNLYIHCTTADGSAGSVTATIAWNDGTTARTQSWQAVLTSTNGYNTAVYFVKLGSGSLSYSTTHTGIYGTSKYAMSITVERLS